MKIPAYWKPDGKAHVVAPSGTFSEERLETGLVLLRESGFEPVVAAGVFDKARYLAGPDEARGAGVRWALGQPGLEVLWAARGGESAFGRRENKSQRGPRCGSCR